jgi:ABC-2 type transport system ATP-binding protein
MTKVIEAAGLTKWYILDVDFHVVEGEVFGFLGPNGAGKTTTIRLLLGLLQPTSGGSTLFGVDSWTHAPEAHRKVSYLGSDPGYLGELSAGAQLDYLATLRGIQKGSWKPIAERLELDASVAVKKLSRGNRQKIGVVQAFMGHEPLIVLDEPTSGLDPLMQRIFLALLAEARADGRTIFLSSHNLPEVERSCDRVGIIREGRLIEISTVQALLSEHWRSVNLVLAHTAPPGTFDLPGVEVASASARDVHLMVQGDVNPLLGVLAGLPVRDISITTPEIEDIFLRYYDGTEGAPFGDGPAAELTADATAEAADRVPEEAVR